MNCAESRQAVKALGHLKFKAEAVVIKRDGDVAVIWLSYILACC